MFVLFLLIACKYSDAIIIPNHFDGNGIIFLCNIPTKKRMELFVEIRFAKTIQIYELYDNFSIDLGFRFPKSDKRNSYKANSKTIKVDLNRNLFIIKPAREIYYCKKSLKRFKRNLLVIPHHPQVPVAITTCRHVPTGQETGRLGRYWTVDRIGTTWCGFISQNRSYRVPYLLLEADYY